MADEYVVERLHDLIHRALPPPRWRGVLDPVAALEELQGWIEDDHQWNEDAQRQNWHSLLDDVLASFTKLPHTVSTLLASDLETPLLQLTAARESLDRDKHEAFGDPLRRSLAESESALRHSLSDRRVLTACWEDLQRAIKEDRLRPRNRDTRAAGRLGRAPGRAVATAVQAHLAGPRRR